MGQLAVRQYIQKYIQKIYRRAFYMMYFSWGQVAWGAFVYGLRFATADHTHGVGFLILLHLAAVLIKNKH